MAELPCSATSMPRALTVISIFILCTIPWMITPVTAQQSMPTPVQQYTYRILQSYPHDSAAFTQGLLVEQGDLYLSTGLYGQSSVRKIELATGKVLLRNDLASRYFGEGITIVGKRLFQLTWQSKTGFIYDKSTLERIGQFEYATEGWGLTHDARRLILSDGSDRLYFHDPDSLRVLGTIPVRLQGAPVKNLNELEFIKGHIFANVWQTDIIVMIAPDSGQVTGIIDLSGLLARSGYRGAAGVLNGIAYDPARDRIYVTGKNWPAIFAIELIPTPATRLK